MKGKAWLGLVTCLVLAFVLAGCGGGGTPPAPTESTHLRDAGAQIVDDSVALFESFSETMQGRFTEVFEDMGTNVGPCLGYFGDTTYCHMRNIEVFFDGEIYAVAPGFYIYDFYTQVISDGGSVVTPVPGARNQGRWNIAVCENGSLKWNCTFIRSADSGQDQLTYTFISTENYGQDQLTLSGTLHYPTQCLDVDWPDSITANGTFGTILDDFVLGSPSCHFEADFSGDVTAFFSDCRINLSNVVLDMEMRPTGGELYELSFEGALSINHDNGSGADPDSLQGTLTASTFTATGRIELYWAENTNITYEDEDLSDLLEGHAPQKLVLDGSLVYNGAGDDDYPSVHGRLTLEIQNAAVFDPSVEDYGGDDGTNILRFKATLEGEYHMAAGNGYQAQVYVEETALDRYVIHGLYHMTSAGVERDVELTVSNLDDNRVHVVITSEFGPASLDVTVTFAGGIDEDTPPSSVTGNVTVAGGVVGTVVMEATGLRINYNDNTFETFVF